MTDLGTSVYLDRLLMMYSNTFNIYMPYRIGEREYPAYGYYFSHNEKYVLVREVNMWSTHSYEHVLFVETEECTETVVDEARKVIQEYMEPRMVRKGEELPEENHMYSYMNVVIISKKPVSAAVQKQIKGFKFEKGYKFNMRGFSRGTILAVSLEDEKYYSNYYGRDKKKMFKQVFDDIKAGKPGFHQIMAEQGIKPYSQEEDDPAR